MYGYIEKEEKKKVRKSERDAEMSSPSRGTQKLSHVMEIAMQNGNVPFGATIDRNKKPQCKYLQGRVPSQ